MPQMSPLLWANLFLSFSLLLLISFVKIYFSNTKNFKSSNKTEEQNQMNNFYWVW